MPFHLGAPELILILVVVLLVFGVGKLPQVAGAIGKGVQNFRKVTSGQSISKVARPKA